MSKSKYEDRIIELEKRVFVKPKPWYQEPGIWVAILAVIIMVYIIYLFYITEIGYEIGVIPWLKPIINQILETIKQLIPESQII